MKYISVNKKKISVVKRYLFVSLKKFPSLTVTNSRMSNTLGITNGTWCGRKLYLVMILKDRNNFLVFPWKTYTVENKASVLNCLHKGYDDIFIETVKVRILNS